jgi:PTH1 family peptidyl-tRNA hydrolase
MLIFAGLGNPGDRHAGNRHNVGFMAVDAIARRHSFSPWTRKFQGLVAEGRLEGEKILLLKPQTYMNLSGQSVGEALRFYRLEPSQLTVFYDEIDLAPAKVRLKRGGGAGGHNGIRSLDSHIGPDYRRVRIGVGHPGARELVSPHVLGDFSKADRQWLDPLLDAIADNAGLLVTGNDGTFMNRVSLAVPSDDATRRLEEGSAAKGVSHIRQARPKTPTVPLPEGGPMAAMLKRLFGKE